MSENKSWKDNNTLREETKPHRTRAEYLADLAAKKAEKERAYQDSLLTKAKFTELTKDMPDDAVIYSDYGYGSEEILWKNLHCDNTTNSIEI